MSPETAVLVTLIAYKVTLVLIGLWAERRSRGVADYFLGGRTLGPLVAAVSASASSSSAWTLVGVSGFAYLKGISAVWLFPACVGGFLFNWFVLAPRLQPESRRTGSITLTEFLARGRRPVVAVASFIVLLSFAAYVASQFRAAGEAFEETFEVPILESVVIGASVVVVYTLLGGFWAVSVTDTLQGLMMALAAVVLPAVAFVEVGGPAGLAGGIAGVAEPGYGELFGGLPLAAGAGFVAGLLGIGLGYPGQPHVVNRFMALKGDAREVRTGRRIAIGWAVVVYTGMILLGLCGRVLLGPLDDHERTFVLLTHELFPPVLAGVILAAVLSAIMSTADSQLLVAASAVTNDLGVGSRDGRPSLAVSRLVVVLLSAGAVVFALEATEDVFNNVLFAWSALGAAFGPLLLVTLLRGLPSTRVTLSAMLTGFSLSVTAYVLRQQDPPLLDTAFLTVVERVGGFAAALLVALLPWRRR